SVVYINISERKKPSSKEDGFPFSDSCILGSSYILKQFVILAVLISLEPSWIFFSPIQIPSISLK
ncbi:hypothetical protein, partial [Planococcus sp. ISL-109]|uniref:hypothetical protein n=1 Tax=Planococcus sp. ISL-109 TaxID=2819166 RepID=UPI001BEA1506